MSKYNTDSYPNNIGMKIDTTEDSKISMGMCQNLSLGKDTIFKICCCVNWISLCRK